MNGTAVLNLLVSAAAAGAVVFVAMLATEGTYTKATIMAAVVAGVTAAVQHLRTPPGDVK